MNNPIPNQDLLAISLCVESILSKSISPLNGKYGLESYASEIFGFHLEQNGSFELELPMAKFSTQYAPNIILRNIQNSISHMQHEAVSMFQIKYNQYCTALSMCNYTAKRNSYCEAIVRIYANYALYFREHYHELWELTLLACTNSKNNTVIISGVIASWGLVGTFHPDCPFQ